jgi:hypothetical protein
MYFVMPEAPTRHAFLCRFCGTVSRHQPGNTSGHLRRDFHIWKEALSHERCKHGEHLLKLVINRKR